MSQNTSDQSHRPRQSLSEMTDAELLCLVLGIRQRDRVSPLLKDGLLGFRWHGKWPEAYAPPIRKVNAARELLRWFAGAQVPLYPCADYGAVMRYLFLAHSRSGKNSIGVVVLDDEGRWCMDKAWVVEDFTGQGVYKVLDLPLYLNPPEFLLFFLHAGGEPGPFPDDEVFAERIRGVIRLVRPTMRIRVLTATAPAAWCFVGDGPDTTPAPPNVEIPRLQEAPAEKVYAILSKHFCRSPDAELTSLATLLSRTPDADGKTACATLLASCGSFTDLAFCAPDELRCPGIPEESTTAIAALLELSRRLGRCEVVPGIARRARTGSVKIAETAPNPAERCVRLILAKVPCESGQGYGVLKFYEEKPNTYSWWWCESEKNTAEVQAGAALNSLIGPTEGALVPFLFKPDPYPGTDDWRENFPEHIDEWHATFFRTIEQGARYLGWRAPFRLIVWGDGRWLGQVPGSRLPQEEVSKLRKREIASSRPDPGQDDG